MTARWAQKCGRCRFIGRVDVNGGMGSFGNIRQDSSFDVYRCGGSLLMRYGPRPEEYFCAPVEKYPVQWENRPDQIGWAYGVAVPPSLDLTAWIINKVYQESRKFTIH